MSKRPPEMIDVFPSRTTTLRSVDHPEGVTAYTVPADWADAAIRSLRAKLFRERATVHELRAGDIWEIHGCLGENIADEYAEPERRKAARFRDIAVRIERGEA